VNALRYEWKRIRNKQSSQMCRSSPRMRTKNTLYSRCFFFSYCRLCHRSPAAYRFLKTVVAGLLLSNVCALLKKKFSLLIFPPSHGQNKNQPQFRSEYNVYSTFQSHEPEFDYLKSLEIEEKINKIRWLPQKNAAQFLLSTNGELVASHRAHITAICRDF